MEEEKVEKEEDEVEKEEVEKEEEVDKTLQSDPPILPIAVFLSNTYWKRVEEDQRNPFNQILPSRPL